MKLAMGTWKLPSKKVMHYAIEQGIRFYDVAYTYNGGRSEKRLGEVERESHVKLTIATKIPPKNMQWPARPDAHFKDVYPYDWIMKITDRSLRHLGREFIDLQQFHVWNDAWAGESEWREAMYQLQASGKVVGFGLSLNDYQPESGMAALSTGGFDFVNVLFNRKYPQAKHNLFQFCVEQGIYVMARCPFASGQNDNGLEYVLGHYEVGKVITGMRSIKHIQKNLLTERLFHEI